MKEKSKLKQLILTIGIIITVYLCKYLIENELLEAAAILITIHMIIISLECWMVWPEKSKRKSWLISYLAPTILIIPYILIISLSNKSLIQGEILMIAGYLLILIIFYMFSKIP
ncbi:MAG: hypothetical protein ABFD79_02175 [Phycisphaerales bacterium]